MGSSAANAAGINVSSTSPTSFSLVAPVSTSVPVFTHNVALSASSVPAAPTTIIPLSNTQQVINLKLTNTNYLFWRIQMKLYLIGQGLFFFVNGSTMCPSPHSDVSDTSTIFCSGFSQAFLMWKQQDQLIISALLSSLCIDVLHLVVDCPTSASVWSTLERALASPSNTRIMQLDGCLQDLRQGDGQRNMRSST
jgi:hypothetical protein